MKRRISDRRAPGSLDFEHKNTAVLHPLYCDLVKCNVFCLMLMICLSSITSYVPLGVLMLVKVNQCYDNGIR